MQHLISFVLIKLKIRQFLFFLMLVCCQPANLHAQGCFRVLNSQTGVEEYEGCFPFQVTVEKCSTITVNATYDFNFPESDLQKPLSQVNLSAFSSTLTRTFEQAGTYYVAQFVNGATTLEIKKIKVFNPQSRPEFTWQVCGTKLQIDFQDSVFTRYEFNPGNSSSSQIINSKYFEYDYGSAIGSSFTFSVKGILPSTCNKDLISQRITIHSTPLSPVPFLLEATGSDTLSFQAKIALRASEDFTFQQAVSGGAFSGSLSAGRLDSASALHTVQLSLPPGVSTQGSQLRVVTLKRCKGVPDQVFDAQPWRVFWPVCEPSNQKIRINWPRQNVTFKSFKLFRDGVFIASPNYQSGTYLDEDNLVCGQVYRYHFETEVTRNSSTGLGVSKYISPASKQKRFPIFRPLPWRISVLR